jgi:hypothetical protein
VIESMPVVNSLCFHTADAKNKAGYRVNVRCGCGTKQVGPVRKSSKRPIFGDCLRELGRLIQQDHGPTSVTSAQKLQSAEKEPRQASSCGKYHKTRSMTCVERKFELQSWKCKWEEYKDTRYSDGDIALVVELWLHRVADDLSGLTFQEWDPSTGSDDTSAPVTTSSTSNSTFVLSVENDNDFRLRSE